MNPASVVLESRCPQTANADPSVSFQPGRTSKTPVGSSVRAAYEHPRGRTKAPSRTNGTATPIPAGTITTRPRANSSRWTPARRPPVRQRKPATVWPWRTDEDEAAFLDRAMARRYLKRARAVMVGHEHSLAIQLVRDDLGHEQLEIYAGAAR